MKYKCKEFILLLAKNSISHYLNTRKILNIKHESIPCKELLGKRGSFVTLHTKDGNLRGCIGKIYGEQELYKDIIENAVYSAFFDPRFPPLSKEELNDIVIEVSILTVPKKIEHNTLNELLLKIEPKKDGIVLVKDGRSATFLPQVWDKIPNKLDFLSNLSIKAGIGIDGWKAGGAEIYKYQVEKICGQ